MDIPVPAETKNISGWSHKEVEMSDTPEYDGPSYKQLLDQKQCMYKRCRKEGEVYQTLVPVVLCEAHKNFRINGKLKV